MAPCLALFLIWAGASLFLLLEPVNGDELLPANFSVSYKSCPETECVFPFVYENRKYFDCTRRGSIMYWCSLDAEYKENWKYCRNKDFARCYFPFIYHNKVYDNCTTLGSFNGKPWCSLSPNYDEDKVWKYC
nr:seminal plasma protein A3-like [Camelus dromedarius]